MSSGDALQFHLGATGIQSPELRDVIMRGPFLAVPSPKIEHTPQETSTASSELSGDTPSPDLHRPPLQHLPSSAYTPSQGHETTPPRVRFRSRVRIRGKRRSTTRPHSADSSGSGSRSSTVSVPLDAQSNRRVIGIKFSALAARAAAEDPEAGERTPLLPEELRRVRQEERRERRALRERQRQIDEDLEDEDEERSWMDRIKSRNWWRRRLETAEHVLCVCCPESEDESDEAG